MLDFIVRTNHSVLPGRNPNLHFSQIIKITANGYDERDNGGPTKRDTTSAATLLRHVNRLLAKVRADNSDHRKVRLAT